MMKLMKKKDEEYDEEDVKDMIKKKKYDREVKDEKYDDDEEGKDEREKE